MKKVLSIFVVALAALVLVACGSKSKVGAGYGLVHGHYVGEFEVTVDSKGVVTKAVFEEYYLPYTWAKVVEGTEGAKEYDYRGAVNYYAPFIKIGDKVFTAVQTGDAPAGETAGTRVVKYVDSNNKDIEELVKTEADAKWYVEQVKAKNFHIAKDAQGTKGADITDANAKKDMGKSKSDYWQKSETVALGWQGNVDAFIKAIVGSKMGVAADKLVRDAANDNDDPRYWSIDGVKTGATWSDFKDYYAVAQRAYNNAK